MTPKPKRRVDYRSPEIKVRICEGFSCLMCGGEESVVRVSLRDGHGGEMNLTDKPMCRECWAVLGRSALDKWSGDWPANAGSLRLKLFLPLHPSNVRPMVELQEANDCNLDDQTSEASQAGP